MEATVLHRVVRGHLATLRLQCAEAGGLPRFVERDFERYLRLVAFSCKRFEFPSAALTAATKGARERSDGDLSWPQK